MTIAICSEPLVPAEVDLRDYPYIPLYIERLFNSDTWALCDADEKVAALRLWCRSWHEEPAGSLPDNDRLLAERAGYGVAVRAFLAVKQNAMRGWVLCNDGRLYHHVVASIALDVWRTKRRTQDKNSAERQRKRLKRAGLSGGQMADVRRTNDVCPADTWPTSSDASAGCPPENALKGEIKEISGAIAPASAPPSDPIKDLWQRGLAVLGGATPQARSLLGKLRKTHGDVVVLQAIARCEAEQPCDPPAYLIKSCEARGTGHAQRKPSPAATFFEVGPQAVDAIMERQGVHEREGGIDRAAHEPLLAGG